ncbi:MAG: rod shape-determining protein MreD [Actinomycetia bacterium]|nr:rod shape-determining protein MreD [Actinomycetes bacterium]
MNGRSRLPAFPLIMLLVALVAQVALAPNVAIGGVVPSLMLCFVVLNSLSSERLPATLYGFFAGLLYDLVSVAPIGPGALTLCIVAFLVSNIREMPGLQFLPMQVLAVVVSLLVGELIYAIVMSVIGYELDFLYSLLTIVLPATVFDSVIAVLILLISKRRKAPKGGTGLAGSGSLKDRLPPI